VCVFVCVLVIGLSLQAIHPLWTRCPAQVCLSVRICVCVGDWVVAAGHPPSMDSLSSTGVSECAYLCVCFGDWVVAASHPPSMDLLSSTGVSECAYLCVCW